MSSSLETKTKTTTRSDTDWITLNVSGKIFRTTRSTLTSDSTSMLAAWLREDSPWAIDGPATDENGALLLDRDPEYFRPVLNFLRTGKVLIDPHVNVEGVLEEARYFQLNGLESALLESLEAIETDLTRKEIISLIATSTHRSFRGLNLNGLNLDALDLIGCDFDYCNLSETSFRGADLSRSTFRSADCTGAKFDAAKISFCSFFAADCSNSSFRFADGDGSLDEYTGFIESELTNADFSDSNLKCARFNMASLIDCRFLRASLHVAGFEKANLLRTNFSGAHVYRARFYEAENMDSCVEPPWLAHLRARGSVGEEGAPPAGGIASPGNSRPTSPTSPNRNQGGGGTLSQSVSVEDLGPEDGLDDDDKEAVPLPVGPSGMLPLGLRRQQQHNQPIADD